jgi:hypothetical protein
LFVAASSFLDTNSSFSGLISQRQKTPEAKPIKSSKFYKEREEPAIVLLYFGVTPRPSRLHSFLSNF